MPLPIVYSPRYAMDLGAHVFPTEKFGAIRERLEAAVAAERIEVVEPASATWDALATVHTADYLAKLRSGDFSVGEMAQLELPWSPDIVEGFRLMTGGTIACARLAATRGIAVHLGGGFHHAFADHGEGFCVFNDVAVAIRVLQAEGVVRRAAVVDCDVHHGNGTAAVFRPDADVFTLSIHQWNNYPAVKPPSTADVHLGDGVRDDEYLAKVEAVLPRVVEFRPDLAFYLAGADPFEEDKLGGLALTKGGLRARDAYVLRTLRAAGVPVAVVLAGGYARRLEDTVAIHVATIEEALAV